MSGGKAILNTANELPLPDYRHLPGLNPRPDTKFLEQIASSALAPTSSDSAAENPAWCYGIRLLNEGYYWEAHEVLEAVWQNALPNSREKYLVQGIIHIANGRLKHQMKRTKAAQRLFEKAAECLERAFPVKAESVMRIEPKTVFIQLTQQAAPWPSIRIMHYNT